MLEEDRMLAAELARASDLVFGGMLIEQAGADNFPDLAGPPLMPEDFTIRRGSSPLILSIPHAGRRLTPGLAERMTVAGGSLIDTDWWLERLYDLPLWQQVDVTLIRADLSRYVIDLNRDPAGASLYPGQATTELVPTATFDGEPIYRAGQATDGGRNRASGRNSTSGHITAHSKPRSPG